MLAVIVQLHMKIHVLYVYAIWSLKASATALHNLSFFRSSRSGKAIAALPLRPFPSGHAPAALSQRLSRYTTSALPHRPSVPLRPSRSGSPAATMQQRPSRSGPPAEAL